MNRLLALLVLLLLPSTAYASQCDQFFPNNKEIIVPETTVLCNTFYATVYDVKHTAAIFSTERYIPHTEKIERTNDFHADARLGALSPTASDYDNTGYDRGHLVPAADAGTDEQMSDTFLMTNMTPQDPSVNRIAWRLLESSIRNMPAKYIVTGALYSAGYKTIGRHKVPVPNGYYKVVYMNDGSIRAFVASNVPKAPIQEVTIATVENISGLKLR